MCGNCKKIGHNRGTCKEDAFVVQGPARKRGRPRKIQVRLLVPLLFLVASEMF